MAVASAVTQAILLLTISSFTGADEAKYLMTIGGQDGSEAIPPSFASLSSGQNAKLPQCMAKTPKNVLTGKLERPVVITLPDGLPLACNGVFDGRKCYKYNPVEDEWLDYGDTLHSGKGRAFG